MAQTPRLQEQEGDRRHWHGPRHLLDDTEKKCVTLRPKFMLHQSHFQTSIIPSKQPTWYNQGAFVL